MNIYIARDGQQYGPYPVESLDAMMQNGQVLDTDLVFQEGTKDWVPVAKFVEQQAATSNPLRIQKPPAAPPPLPSAEAAGPSLRVGGLTMSAADLERQVLAGGRFVIFQYCVSVLVMTFKRPSEVIFLKSHEDGFAPAFTYSLISLLAGWWGIPWGPIWTVATVAKNATGGTDVTQAVLTDIFGAPRASAILAQRRDPAPAGLGLKLFRWGLIGAIALPVVLIGFAMAMAGRTAANRAAPPAGVVTASSAARQAFDNANRQINVNQGSNALGNSTEARAIAGTFSRQMRVFREKLFTGDNKSGVATKGEFLTWCELREGHCVFLVHVPELRRFDTEAQKALGELAWALAQAAVQKQGAAKPGMKLVVGIRGVLMYERVLEGECVPKADDKAHGVATVTEGSRAKERLYAYFSP